MAGQMPLGETSEFDIYETGTGYVPVRSDVRRRILDALNEQDRELPELAKLAGKSKSTLSSIHLRALKSNGLVQELPHPSDRRRKVYHLVGRKIGNSAVPVERLRSAIRRYVTLRPTARPLTVRTALAALLVARDQISAKALRAQAQALGQQVGTSLQAATPEDFAVEASRFLEKEGLAQALRIDFERGAMALRLGADDAASGSEAIAAFIEGLAQARGLSANTEVAKSGRQATLTVSLAPAGASSAAGA